MIFIVKKWIGITILDGLPFFVEKADAMLKLYIFAVVDELTVAMPVEFLDVFLVIDQVLPFDIPEPLISIDWDSNGVVSGSIEVAVV